MLPQVSVIIPAYNRAKILPRAINSILSQTFQDFEIIVVDDCSKDNTDEVVRQYDDPRIRYTKHIQNKGGSAARNTGIKEARGEFIAFLDSDDEWLPNKLDKQINRFNQINGDCGLIYTYLEIVDREGNFLKNHCVDSDGEVLKDLLVANFIASTSSIIVKKKYMDQIGGFDTEMKSCQDWDLYIRLSQVCQIFCIPEPLTKHYVDESANRISNDKSSVIKGHLRIQEKFRQNYEKLPIDLRLKHLNNFSFFYLKANNLQLSIQMLLRAFVLSMDPRYLLRVVKRTYDYLMVKR
jgi:glycosyltransferase involved in cell wall biosynthesis